MRKDKLSAVMALVRSRTNRRGKLTLIEAIRATELTERLTCFNSFTALLGFYRDISFRDLMWRKAGPALMASWSEEDRKNEEIEHSLLLELADLVELAQGAKRRIVAQISPVTKRTAQAS